MDWFWLTFTRPQLERRYHRYTTYAKLCAVDQSYLFVSLAVRAVALWRFARAVGHLRCFQSYVYMVWLGAECAARRKISQHNLWLWRTPLVILSR